MTQYWEPGTDYNLGDVVEYEGVYVFLLSLNLHSQFRYRPQVQDYPSPSFTGDRDDRGSHTRYSYILVRLDTACHPCVMGKAARR